jgi:hypothetical protein
MEPAVTKRIFSVDEYYRMAEAGVLAEDERVELIEGEIIALSPIGDSHMICVNRLNWLLTDLLRGIGIVSVQNPIRLGAYSHRSRTSRSSGFAMTSMRVLIPPRMTFYSL